MKGWTEIFLKKEKKKKKKIKKIPRDPVTKEIYEKIRKDYSNIKGNASFVEKRTYVVVTMLYLTGLRINELQLITWKHWKELEKKNSTEFTETKTKKKRTIFLDKKEIGIIKKEMEELFKLNPNTILIKENGEKLHEKVSIVSINNYLKKYSKIFNKNLQSHSFRIGLVTRLFEKGVHADLIKEIIGHGCLATTLLYNRAKYTEEVKKQALKKINKIK